MRASMCVGKPRNLVLGERYAMFWQRLGVEKSGWHNVMLFTEECDALSSLDSVSSFWIARVIFSSPLLHSLNSLFSSLSLPSVPAS